MNFTVKQFTGSDHRSLIELWEASVRATHTFLSEEHISEFKRILGLSDFKGIDLHVVASASGIAGFMGTAGQKLEMLFIHPGYAGKGLGSKLLGYAIANGVKEVDVNEQNPNALRFYSKHGFEIISRSELDDFGNPFPILHLSLVQNER